MVGATYWFGTGTGFGEGAAVFFPGGPAGVRAFTLALAGVALLLGIDVQSQWDRQRARKLLESRIASSARIVLYRAVAATIAGGLIAVVMALAAPLLALRSGRLVLWEPTALYVLLTALPVVWLGVGAGMLARTWIRSDLAAMVSVESINNSSNVPAGTGAIDYAVYFEGRADLQGMPLLFALDYINTPDSGNAPGLSIYLERVLVESFPRPF